MTTTSPAQKLEFVNSGHSLIWMDSISQEECRQAALSAHRNGNLAAFGGLSGISAGKHVRTNLKLIPDPYLSDTKPLPMVTNVVIDIKLGNYETLPRERLLAMFPTAQIKPKFGSGMFRFGQPNVTDLVWPNLSVVQSGAKNKMAAILATQELRMLLMMSGMLPTLTHYSVNNCVYKFNLECPIDLDRMAKEQPALFVYYQELFPGAFHLEVLNKTCVLVFWSGKGVAMGPSPENQMITYVRDLYPTILKYKLTPEEYRAINQQTEKSKNKDQAFKKEKARSELAARKKRIKTATESASTKHQQQQQQRKKGANATTAAPPSSPQTTGKKRRKKGTLNPTHKAAEKALRKLYFLSSGLKNVSELNNIIAQKTPQNQKIN